MKIKFLLFLLPFQLLLSQAKVISESFYSEGLGETVDYKIVLPQNLDDSKKYPVVYLLHGLGASPSEWITNTNVIEYANEFPFIYVLPDGKESWYINSTDNKKFEDYIVKELPEQIKNDHPVDLSREAIAGYSMGGYGALILSLRHPDKYWFAGVMSASFDIPGEIDSLEINRREWLSPSLQKAFGMNRKKIDSYNPFLIYDDRPGKSLPYIYLVTGIDEVFTKRIKLQRKFADLLFDKGFKYEMHETPGDHDYKFWDRELYFILIRMNQLLSE